MESHIQIYAFMNLTPQKKNFCLRLYERTEYDYYDMVYETLVKLSFMLSLSTSPKLLFKEPICFK